MKLTALKFDNINIPKLNRTVNLDSIDELDLLENRNYANMMHICIEEEITLKNNIKFFEKLLKSQSL